jgi:hypothetical protein
MRSEWLAAGMRLGAMGRANGWWIGDWIRYGLTRWGEKYSEAARVTGYDTHTLRNMAYVASRFDSSLRRDKLSWSHHAVLAPYEPQKQQHWLDRCEEDRLSVADLKAELRQTQIGELSQPASLRSRSESVVCPRCGFAMESKEAHADQPDETDVPR